MNEAPDGRPRCWLGLNVMYTLPNLSRRLEEKGIMVSTFATQWMLSLFMRNPFRVDKALALWDTGKVALGANHLTPRAARAAVQ